MKKSLLKRIIIRIKWISSRYEATMIQSMKYRDDLGFFTYTI